MKENYDQALRLVLKHEGGYVNHPKDPGGATNKGVTQKTYDGWRQAQNQKPQSVRNIHMDEVKAIYKDQYAKPIWFDKLPSGVDYAVFDFAVNSGVSRAVKTVQKIVGQQQDGVMGNITLSAIKEYDSELLVEKLCAHRLAFMKRLKTWSVFGKGWQRRVTSVKSNALAMAKSSDIDEDIIAVSGSAEGQQSLMGSIASSSRSKAAVAGTVGAVMTTVPEAMELAAPIKETFAWGKYAAIIGAVITIAALVYIIWFRKNTSSE